MFLSQQFLCAFVLLQLLVNSIVSAGSFDISSSNRPRLWTWLSGNQVDALAQLEANQDIVSDVSLGGYSVGSDLSLQGSGPDRTILSKLKEFNITAHPLIGCSDVVILRALFSNVSATSKFVADAVQEAMHLGLGGFNIDFEPYSAVNPTYFSDALLFAKFADTLAKGLHASGQIKLSIDYFSNLAFWNIGALNATTEVDYLISMDTYVPGNISFQIYDEIGRASISSSRLGLGLCTGVRSPPFTPFGPDPCGISPWTAQQVEERLEYIFAGPHELPAMLNIWVLPVPDIWWTALRKWLSDK